MAYRKDWAAAPQVAADGYVGAVKMPGRRVNLTVSDLSTAGNTIGAFTVPAGFVVTGCIVVYSAMDAGAFVQSSATTVLESASIATVIGTLSVIGGTGPAYTTFTETADPDNKFTIVGTQLRSSAAFNYETATSHQITVTATNGVEPIVTTLTITVTNVLEITLAALTLNTSTIAEGAAAGTLVGTLQSVTSGSSLAMTDTAGGRFALSGNTVVAGATATNYETATSHNITVQETHADGTNSPRSSVIAVTVTNVLEITLAALSLSSSTIVEGSAEDTAVGALVGVTSGSSLTMTDTAGGKFKLSGSNVVAGASPTDFGTATSHNITVRETHADGSNSPRDSVIAISVTETGGGGGTAGQPIGLLLLLTRST